MSQKPALVFLVLVGAGFVAWHLSRPDPVGNALRARELATRGLAEHLARTYPGKRVLVVSNPFTQQDGAAKEIVQMDEAGIRGLREGFGDKIKIAAVAFPELKPGALENPQALLAEVETTTPLSHLVSTNAFDRLAKEHLDCEIIVSLIGLPLDVERCETWKASDTTKFALLLPDFRGIASAAKVQQAVSSGKLPAFVLAKYGVQDEDSSLSGDFKAEFEKRFILVTGENIDHIIQTRPELF